MIQKTNSRASSSAAAPTRQSTDNDGPESWGQWVGRKHYALEVVQHPLRARMCGFGDKDRRPLAPAAVAKMIVTRDDNTVVDVDEIDCSFFLVTVDLWSAEGKHEMNLVLHPTSADRYVPANAPKAKRRATNATAPSSSRTGRQSPTPTASASGSSQSQYPQPTGMAPYISPTTSGYPAPAYPYSAQQAQPTESSFQAQSVNPYSSQPDPNMPAWGYAPGPSMDRTQPHYPPALPPIQPVSRSAAGPATGSNFVAGANTAENWPVESQGRDDAGAMPYRQWPQQEASYSPIDSSTPSSAVDPSLRVAQSEARDSSYGQMTPTPTDPYPQGRYAQEPYSPIGQQGPPPPLDGPMYPPAPYAQPPPPPSHQGQAQGQYQQTPFGQDPAPSSSNIPPLPRHTYTRTLVGPLSANACRLADEHRKSGIFFLFQDLSIRTEGTFRLRLRLMNIGAPPAPEYGAPCVHNSVSPVLAQTFTEPFVVYSAKRFPGVPDTTALSIALGNQGQKLPLRNRNGSTKSRKRRRDNSGSEASGDESDEA